MSDFTIKLIPDNVSMAVDEEQVIMVVFDPANYADQTGDWYADSEYFEQMVNTISILKVRALKVGITSITYTPAADPSQAVTIPVYISRDNDGSLTLSPTSEDVNVGDDFYIDVSYADNSFRPMWVFDQSLIQKQSDSTDKRAHFKALNQTDPDGTVLSCMLGKEVANNICIIKESDVTLKLIPETTTQLFGSDYYVDIIYSPDNGHETGSWDDDNVFIELLPDSTSYRAHFKVVKESDQPISRTFTSHGKSVTHTCTIAEGALKQIKVSSVLSNDGNKTVTVYSGEIVPVDVEYIPNYAPHVCYPETGVNDDKFISVDKIKSNNEKVYFKAGYPIGFTTVGVNNRNDNSSDTIASNRILVTVKEVPCDTFKFDKHYEYQDIMEDDVFVLTVNTVPEFSFVPDGQWVITEPDKVQLLPDTDGNRQYTKEYRFKLLSRTPEGHQPVSISYVTKDNKSDTCFLTIGPTGSVPATGVSTTPTRLDNVNLTQEFHLYGNILPEHSDASGRWVSSNSNNYIFIYPGDYESTHALVSFSNTDIGAKKLPDDYVRFVTSQPDGTDGPSFDIPITYVVPTHPVMTSIISEPPYYENCKIGDTYKFTVKCKPDDCLKEFWAIVDERVNTIVSQDATSVTVKVTGENNYGYTSVTFSDKNRPYPYAASYEAKMYKGKKPE